ILLVELEVLDFGRERQVLDRSPTGDHADLEGVEVGVTGVANTLTRMAESKGRAILTLRSGQIADRAIKSYGRRGAPHAGRPIGIPVVVERTAETVSRRQLEVAGTAEDHRKVHSVRGHTQPDALISDAAAAEHREVRRG